MSTSEGFFTSIDLGTCQQVGMDARSLAEQGGGRKGQTDRGAKNAQQRRLRAFRQALVRAVVPSHTAFLRQMQLQQQPGADSDHRQQSADIAENLGQVRSAQQQQQQRWQPQEEQHVDAAKGGSTGNGSRNQNGLHQLRLMLPSF